MDNQDQTRTHTAGHESHGVHLCHNCGWPFPNPHPSAKHRRAHKKICGTIEGYKLFASEGQPRLNGSDDEHVSDDDHKTPDLVVSGPNSLETGNNEKGNDGNGEKLIRLEDEVFSDAVADFSDSGSNLDIKERLQYSLDSGADWESSDIIESKFSGSSEDKDFNAADASQLIDKSTDGSPIQNLNIVQNESVKVVNTMELQGQLSGPVMDPFSSSMADSRAEESTTVVRDVFLGLSSDSAPGEAQAMPDTILEKNIYAGENETDCSLVSVAKETTLKEKDEINSSRDVVEIMDSSGNIVGKTCEGVSKIAVSDAVSLDHQVGDGAGHLKEKNGTEIIFNRYVVELVESPDKVVNETSEEVSEIAVSDVVSFDHQVVNGAVNLEEKNVNLPLELNSVVIINNSEEESALVVNFATSSDDVILQEKGEVQVIVDPLPTHDDRSDEAHPHSQYGGLKDHKGVEYQNLFLHSSESLNNEGDDFRETVTEENKFQFKTSQLSEKSDVLSLDTNVIDSSLKMDLFNSEPTPKEMDTGECTEVSPPKLTVKSHQRSDDIDACLNAMKTDTNENIMVHFSEEHGHDEAGKNFRQISLPDISFMASSHASHMDEPFGSATRETTSVIKMHTSHHEEKRTEINDVALYSKIVGYTVEKDIEIILKDLQPGDIFHSEVKQSDDLFKSDDASDAAVEMGKNEQCDSLDALCMERPIMRDTSLPKSAGSYFESPVISESSDIVVCRPAKKSNETESRKIDLLSGARKDKEDEIKINTKISEEHKKSLDTSAADSYQDRDAELLGMATENLAMKYTSPLTTESSAQHDDSSVYSTAVPVQDQTSNSLGKLVSSRIDASVDSGSRCDSLEGHWGSVSVLSMQSDAPAVIDAETLPSTGLPASTEAEKSNMNNPKAASERQQSGKSETFERPSFMTLVEPRKVSPKAAASELQKGQNLQKPDSTSQAAWFPTLTQVVTESQGRNKNEEVIAKVTNWSTTCKEHAPLKSLLREAAHRNKPESQKMEENSVNKSGKVPVKNGSGLTTVNSILGPESPAAQVVKGEAAKEWNSPARYPADITREKRKVKSRPYWIQFVCCTSVGPQRR